MGKIKNRVGEQNRAINGQMMTITEYNGINKLTIRFEDGTEVRNKSYKAFKTGEINNPNVNLLDYRKQAHKTLNREGETVKNTEGIRMTIIKYRGAHDIDVLFENNIVVRHKNYNHFKNGRIKCPNKFENGISIVEFAYRKNDQYYYICEKEEWGERKILPVQKIVEGTTNDIAAKLDETEENEKSKHDNHIYGSILGMEGVASNGMRIKCIKDNGAKDVSVEFEDGQIVEHQRRESFKRGHIRHPDKKNKSAGKRLEQHIGEIFYDKFGRKMTIIEYHSNSNVTVEYEDGTRVYDKEYRIVKNGGDIYPKSLFGQKRRAINGLMMEVIRDESWHNLYVKFEDGTVVNGVTRQNFMRGNVKYPEMNSRTNRQKQDRIGMETQMKNGLKAKIVGYKNAKDVDILFENGLLVKHREYDTFIKKRLGMPRYVGQIYIKDFAYRLHNDWYYQVSNKDWKEDRIMSVKEMYEHENTDHATIRKEK